MQAVIKDPVYLTNTFYLIITFSLIVILFDCMRWLSKNRDSIVSTVMTAISFTIVIMIMYLVFLA